MFVFKNLAKHFRLMEEAGSEGSAGGSATAAPEKTAPPTDAKAEAEAPKADGTKISDSEASLLREVMDKKQKLKTTSDELAALKSKMKEFDGIDVSAVRKMLDDQKTVEQRKLEEKGEWDSLKKQLNDAHALQLSAERDLSKAESEKSQGLNQKIAELTVGSAFSQSKFILEELALTPSKTRIIYGSYFEFDDNQVIAFDKPAGMKNRTQLIDSKGDPLGFEEAIKKIVEGDPDKDSLLKSKQKSGAGSSSIQKASPPKSEVELTGLSKISAGLRNFK